LRFASATLVSGLIEHYQSTDDDTHFVQRLRYGLRPARSRERGLFPSFATAGRVPRMVGALKIDLHLDEQLAR